MTNGETISAQSLAIARSLQPFRSSLPEPSIGMVSTRLIVRGTQRLARRARRVWPAVRLDDVHRGKQHEGFAFRLVGHAGHHEKPLAGGKARASEILVSTVSCGTISPAILEKRESRPSM